MLFVSLEIFISSTTFFDYCYKISMRSEFLLTTVIFFSLLKLRELPGLWINSLERLLFIVLLKKFRDDRIEFYFLWLFEDFSIDRRLLEP